MLDHVRADLEADHSLEDLARVACFSPFHFHRVFRSATGETVRGFVERMRVERAAFLLGRGASRRLLVDLALECGFSSSSEFSRAFRARFGVSPSEFRRSRTMSKIPQEPVRAADYRSRHVAFPDSPGFSPTLVTHTTRSIAYVRVADPFDPRSLDAARRILLAWADTNGHRMDAWLGVSHDDPDVTPLELCRYDAAFVVPPDAVASDGVAIRAVPAGTFVEVVAGGSFDAIASTWDRLFAEWLPSSGYEPGDGPGIERYDAGVALDGDAPIEVVLTLPVRRV